MENDRQLAGEGDTRLAAAALERDRQRPALQWKLALDPRQDDDRGFVQ